MRITRALILYYPILSHVLPHGEDFQHDALYLLPNSLRRNSPCCRRKGLNPTCAEQNGGSHVQKVHFLHFLFAADHMVQCEWRGKFSNLSYPASPIVPVRKL